MKNSAALLINGFVFLMGCNEPSPSTLENHVLYRKPISTSFLGFLFPGRDLPCHNQNCVQLPAPKLTLLLSKHVNMSLGDCQAPLIPGGTATKARYH